MNHRLTTAIFQYSGYFRLNPRCSQFSGPELSPFISTGYMRNAISEPLVPSVDAFLEQSHADHYHAVEVAARFEKLTKRCIGVLPLDEWPIEHIELEYPIDIPAQHPNVDGRLFFIGSGPNGPRRYVCIRNSPRANASNSGYTVHIDGAMVTFVDHQYELDQIICREPIAFDRFYYDVQARTTSFTVTGLIARAKKVLFDFPFCRRKDEQDALFMKIREYEREGIYPWFSFAQAVIYYEQTGSKLFYMFNHRINAGKGSWTFENSTSEPKYLINPLLPQIGPGEKVTLPRAIAMCPGITDETIGIKDARRRMQSTAVVIAYKSLAPIEQIMDALIEGSLAELGTAKLQPTTAYSQPIFPDPTEEHRDEDILMDRCFINDSDGFQFYTPYSWICPEANINVKPFIQMRGYT